MAASPKPNIPPLGHYLAPRKASTPVQHARVPAEPTEDHQPEENEIKGAEPSDVRSAQKITKCESCGQPLKMAKENVARQPLNPVGGPKPGQVALGSYLGKGSSKSPEEVEAAMGRSANEGTGSGLGASPHKHMNPLQHGRADHPFPAGQR